MALLFIDSFDHMATADLTQKYSAAPAGTIQPAAGRRGSQALRLADGVIGAVSRLLPVTGSVVVIGVALKTTSFPSLDNAVVSVMSGPDFQCSLGLSGTGHVQAWCGNSSGTLLGTASAGALTAGVFAYIEFKATVHPSAGTFAARVNGTTVLTLTGVNTANAGGTAWDNIYFSGLTPVTAVDVDDFYVLDGAGPAPWNDFLGDVRVDARYPTGAGATTEWTPSTGANWSCVDEATPNDDTDYVSAAAAVATDTYVVEDAPVESGVIYGVQVLWNIKKLDDGTCSVAPVVRHSSTDYPGTDQDPDTAYAYQRQIYATNPGTSAQWTESDFNAAEFGVTRTA